MADQHDTAAQALDEVLQAFQTVEVEVIGRFVEKHNVEPGEQEGGEADAGGLAAGQGGHQLLIQARTHLETEVGEDHREAFLQVGGTTGQPPVECERVGIGGRVILTERCGRLIHVCGGLGTPGAPCHVACDGFTLHTLMLLGQPPDESVGG